jgi:hypothetical protein
MEGRKCEESVGADAESFEAVHAFTQQDHLPTERGKSYPVI